MSDIDDIDNGVELLSKEEILEHAIPICLEYYEDNATLTVRGLYYKFIGRGIVSPEELSRTNERGKVIGAERFCKRVGDVCRDARLDGLLPMEHIIDEGRDVIEGDFRREDLDVDAAHDTAGSWIQEMHTTVMATDRWVHQPKFVSVWVEKQGLTTAIKPLCTRQGVTFLATKGYPSITVLEDWRKLADFAINGDVDEKSWRLGSSLLYDERQIGGYANEAVVLYAGDADPDGYEIPRSAERNLRRLMDTAGSHFPLRFERVGLNVDQARELDLPPFQAKPTSSRYKKFRAEHNTDDAWEVDAMDLRHLRQLFEDGIARHWDAEIGRRVAREAARRSDELLDRISDPDWLRGLFE